MCFWLSISIFWPWDISAFQIIQTGRDLMVNLCGRMFARSLHQQQTFLLAPHQALWDLKMLRPGSKGCSGDRSDKAESRSDWSTHKGCSIFFPSCTNPLCIVTVLVEMMCLAGRQRCRKETFLSSAIYSTIWGTVAINLYPSSNFSAAKEERSLGPMQFPGCNTYVHIYHTSLLQNFKFSFRLCPGESLCHISHSHPQTLLSFSLFLSILVSMDQSLCCVIYQAFTSYGSSPSPLSFHISCSWGVNPGIGPFKSSETPTASAPSHFCCPCSTPGFSVLF